MTKNNRDSEIQAGGINWKYVWPMLAAAAVILGDLYTKQLILDAMFYGEYVRVTPYLNIVHVQNSGAAFGMFAGANSALRVPFFIVVSLIAFVVITVLVHKSSPERKLYLAGLGLILGGAGGNFVDRIRFGYVVDFLDFHWGSSHWPAFNVADIAISVGVGLLLLEMVIDEVRERRAKRAETA